MVTACSRQGCDDALHQGGLALLPTKASMCFKYGYGIEQGGIVSVSQKLVFDIWLPLVEPLRLAARRR